MEQPYTPDTRAEQLALARWFDAKAREYKERRKQANPEDAADFNVSIKAAEVEADRLRNIRGCV